MSPEPVGPDAVIESYAQAYDAMLPGFGIGDIVRDTWRELTRWLFPPACDCELNPHHRWNCALTPIWAQAIRDLDANPWTVVTHTVHRFGLDLTPESFERLGRSLDAITEAERKAWDA